MLALLSTALIVGACSIGTETPFERAAGDAASAYSAAATTLRFAHDDRLSREYSLGSLELYREAVSGVDTELPTLEGAPGSDRVDQLVHAVQAAEPVLEDPCLEVTCDWRSQLQALEQAAQAFEDALAQQARSAS